jgi:hypothetical protein
MILRQGLSSAGSSVVPVVEVGGLIDECVVQSFVVTGQARNFSKFPPFLIDGVSP